MRDVIDCPDCGGQLIREGELSVVYSCDCCGLRREDGVYVREQQENELTQVEKPSKI